MDKKELVLTVAKDLVLGTKVFSNLAGNAEGKAADLGKILGLVSKQVEAVYDSIKDSSPTEDTFA